MEQEYMDLVSKLSTDFEKNILDNEVEKEKLIEAFKSYLARSISNIRNSKSKFVGKDSETIKRIIKKIAQEFYNMNITSMKQMLLEDESFKKLKGVSMYVFDLAKRKKNGEKIAAEFDISSEIEQMDELLKNVAPYNKTQAEQLISEAVLDLKYISQGEEKISSLRLHHFVKSLKQMEEER